MAPAKKTKKSSTSDVSSNGGVISGEHVNTLKEDTAAKMRKGRSVTQMNSHPGFIFKDEDVYGGVREVDQEATRQAHAALKSSEDE